MGLRAALAVVLTAGFAALVLVTTAVLLLLPVLAFRVVRFPVLRLLFLCVVAAGILLWSAVPRRARFVPSGPRLRPSDQPRLFHELAELARLAGQRPPAEVSLSAEPVIDVLRLWPRRPLVVIGLPVLVALRRSELRAALLHELTHHRCGGTPLGPWIAASRRTVEGTLRALRSRGQVALHLPFALYGGFFLRVTAPIARRQELEADALAAGVVGAEPVLAMLRAIPAAARAYRAYWHAAYLPVLTAGFRPPLADGFAAYLARSPIQNWYPRADTGLPAERVAALAAGPAGPARPPGGAAIGLLDRLPSLEAELVVRTLPKGTPAPTAIDWSEVGERVVVPRWRRLASAAGDALAGAWVSSLPALARSAPEIGARAARALGMEDGEEVPWRQAQQVLGAALGLALRRAGWRVEVEPGPPPVLRGPPGPIDPFAMVMDLLSGESDAAGWLRRCGGLGIDRLPLSLPGSEPVALPADRQRARTARLLSRACTTGWLDWCWGDLWLLPDGLLRRRRGWGATVADSFRIQATGRTVDPARPRSEPMDQVHVEVVAAAHRTNRWIARSDIASASLRRGVLSGRLRLELVDGRRVTFLWMAADRADQPLRAALAAWLGSRLARG